jgi:hypothetical protein
MWGFARGSAPALRHRRRTAAGRSSFATLTLLAVLAAGASLTAAPSALADRGDAAVTLAYLRADRTLLLADSGQLAAGQAALGGFAATTAGECPLVASGAPVAHRGEMALEVFYAAGIAFTAPFRQARLRFAEAVERLRWTNGKLTLLARLYATAERAEAALAEPRVCASLREWVAGGYGPVPPGVARFLKEATSVPVPSEEILGLLGSAIQRNERGLLRSVRSLEGRVEGSVLNSVFEGSERLEQALGFPAASAGAGASAGA